MLYYQFLRPLRGKQINQRLPYDNLLACRQPLHWAQGSCFATLLNWLADRYDTEDKKLNVTRGPIHDYLGMNVDFLALDNVA